MERKRNYIFTDKRYSKRSVMSSVFGLIAMVSIGCAIYYTYKRGGEAPLQYGFVVILAIIYSVIGLVLGIISKIEKDQFYLFSYMGLVLNTVNLMGIIWIFFMGVH